MGGRLIFSKATAHRFPNCGEVEAIFAALKEGKELPPVEEEQPAGFVGRILGKLRN